MTPNHDTLYAVYELYLSNRKPSDPMWTFSGWLQHAGLSERFPAEEYVANKAHSIPGSFEQPTIPRREVEVLIGGGRSRHPLALGPIQRKCLAGPNESFRQTVARVFGVPEHLLGRASNRIQQNAFELDKADALAGHVPRVSPEETVVMDKLTDGVGELDSKGEIVKLPYDVKLEVGYLLSAGKVIDAFKRIREAMPVTLFAAKSYIDRVRGSGKANWTEEGVGHEPTRLPMREREAFLYDEEDEAAANRHAS